MILYETARLIRDRHLPAPVKLFFSGRPAPETPAPESPIHRLPDGEFAERILDMGATSEEIFASKPLRDVFMPILRADFRLVETYKYEAKNHCRGRSRPLRGRREVDGRGSGGLEEPHVRGLPRRATAGRTFLLARSPRIAARVAFAAAAGIVGITDDQIDLIIEGGAR